MRIRTALPLFLALASPAQKILIDSIQIQSLDPFADSKFHSNLERSTADFFGKFHINTRPSLIHALLPFKQGDSVDLQSVKDFERFLRTQPYLNTARIIFDSNSTKSSMKVEVQDKWSLSPMVALAKPANKWDWALGLYEYNLLGFGIQTGLSYIDIRDKQGWQGFLGVPNFLLPRQRLDLAFFGDGESYESYASLNQTLSTLDQKFAWTASLYSKKNNRPIFAPNDAALNWKLLSGLAEIEPTRSDFATLLGSYRAVKEDSAALQWINNSKWGKFYVQGILKSEWLLRRESEKDSLYKYAVNNPYALDTTRGSSYFKANSFTELAFREDWFNGFALQLHLPHMYKLQNFHRLKYTEDIDLGLKIASGLYADLRSNDGYGGYKWTSGLDWGYLLSQAWVGNIIWRSSFRPSANHKDGSFKVRSEQMWILSKHRSDGGIPRIQSSLVLNNEWNQIWQKPSGEYLQLGAYEGLSGTPDYAYVGNKASLNQLEFRYIPGPEWELGTIVPAFTTFVNAGGAWSTKLSSPWNDLDYRFGLGLRLGASKSVQGLINTLDLSWPLNSKVQSGPSFNLIAKYTF